MANSKSAKKRIKTSKRNRLINRFYLSSVKTLNKKFQNLLEQNKYSQDLKNKLEAEKLLKYVYSLLDKGTKKQVFHRNNAARKKARFARVLKLF